MKIIYKQEEQWQLGDVVKSISGDIGVIIQDDICNYRMINITTNYLFVDKYDKPQDLQKDFQTRWHKVNAKLVIE
ncbi:hypothetical protein RON44_00290 [Lactobacillus gasseri]|uniref:hypothetical protein n=1 Tax=Lactobacillus gasseri TaxID=1596 RepID=UPI000E4327B1|nr:hypothetical protein [Lactobacillus gasseri]MCZ3944394.1 hypothetical protein [Lactobacillus gasseri]MCZ3947104.1 hypothetical protein [Lactobacillus gasseri]MCZ3980964.1 hypothetical protein [Lactobacillus gasseri]MCZ3995124.1 hypothetical protein [Lactobacillus gasseri]MCZ4003342.1 hypothetical protein [Lactobacillus gasseri]